MQVFRSHPSVRPAIGRRHALPVVAAAFLAAALAWLPLAAAHTRTSTISEIAVTEQGLEWSLRIRAADLMDPLGLANDAGLQEVIHASEAVSRYVLAHLRVMTPAGPCVPTAEPPITDPAGDEPRILLLTHFVCGDVTASRELYYELFFDLDPLHTGFARVSLDGEAVATHLFRKGGAPLSIAGSPEAWRQTLQYLVLGIEHIFLGYDHLAFLAALILGTALVRRSRRSATPPVLAQAAARRQALSSTIALVTAFTIAHSITLGVAALQTLAIPLGWVEPAIALSVAYVGFENLVPRIPRRRWLLTFGFGLIHGFGFASVLQEIGLPKAGLLRSLLAFNVGVELGQLAVVSAVLPVILWVANRNPGRFERWGLGVLSAGIGVAGLVWFVLRML